MCSSGVGWEGQPSGAKNETTLSAISDSALDPNLSSCVPPPSPEMFLMWDTASPRPTLFPNMRRHSLQSPTQLWILISPSLSSFVTCVLRFFDLLHPSHPPSYQNQQDQLSKIRLESNSCHGVSSGMTPLGVSTITLSVTLGVTSDPNLLSSAKY